VTKVFFCVVASPENQSKRMWLFFFCCQNLSGLFFDSTKSMLMRRGAVVIAFAKEAEDPGSNPAKA
jgi:hypothetical protein